jgi:hypothetical protein
MVARLVPDPFDRKGWIFEIFLRMWGIRRMSLNRLRSTIGRCRIVELTGRGSATSFRVAFEELLLVGKELHRQSKASLASGDFKNCECSWDASRALPETRNDSSRTRTYGCLAGTHCCSNLATRTARCRQ